MQYHDTSLVIKVTQTQFEHENLPGMKKTKKSSKALLYVWPYNLLEKSQIFAFVQEHHMQKYFPVADLRPYTIARNFQSEQQYLKHKP